MSFSWNASVSLYASSRPRRTWHFCPLQRKYYRYFSITSHFYQPFRVWLRFLIHFNIDIKDNKDFTKYKNPWMFYDILLQIITTEKSGEKTKTSMNKLAVDEPLPFAGRVVDVNFSTGHSLCPFLKKNKNDNILKKRSTLV